MDVRGRARLMARPSDRYPSERPGKPCGASWSDPLRVTGKIPNLPFGAQFEVTLQPVALAKDMRANQGMLSWRGEHEARVRAALETTIDQVMVDAQKFRPRIGEDNYQAVRNLLALALAELAHVDITHEAWVARRWGLERVTYASECDARGGPGPGEVFGGGFDRCPTVEEIDRRFDAREYILEKFIDACHFTRCAQFGLWRVWLYRQAREAWKNTPQGGAPDGLAPTPPKKPRSKVGPGSFTAKPPGPPPPPTPPKPEPPAFPSDLGVGESLPDPGEPEPPDEDDVPVPPLPPPPLPVPPVSEPPMPEPPVSEPPMPEPPVSEPAEPEPPASVGEPVVPPSSGDGGGLGSREPAVDGVLVEGPPGDASFDPRTFREGANPYSMSADGDGVRSELVDAEGKSTKDTSVVGAVAKVATAAVVVGGLVGITYLVTRERKSSRR